MTPVPFAHDGGPQVESRTKRAPFPAPNYCSSLQEAVDMGAKNNSRPRQVTDFAAVAKMDVPRLRVLHHRTLSRMTGFG